MNKKYLRQVCDLYHLLMLNGLNSLVNNMMIEIEENDDVNSIVQRYQNIVDDIIAKDIVVATL